jgi:hypothetical protein
MKRIVKEELEGEGFVVLEEPLYPPSRRVSWSGYRPDLLAYRAGRVLEELAVVEAETHPNAKRFARKNFASLGFQPHLFQTGSIRQILAVPQGRLRSVDLGLRKEWEIWILGTSGPMHKISRLGGSGEEPIPSASPEAVTCCGRRLSLST